MPRKAKQKKGKDAPQLTAHRRPDEREEDVIARTVVRPTVQSGYTLKAYGKSFGDLELGGLVNALSEQTEAVENGQLGRGEAMLTAQAHTLDAIFNNLARRAITSDYIDHLDRYLKLALKAQSQCRTSWEAVASIKNPPAIGYVRQANIAHGPQQVNNGPDKPRKTAPETKTDIQKNKLLEQGDEQWLDTGTPGAPGGTDPAMAAVGEVDRAEDD